MKTNNNFIKKVILTTFLISQWGIINAQNIDIQSFDIRISFLLDSLSKQFKYPGFAISIVKDTSTIYTKTFGVKKINLPDKITENTKFYFASVSKVFTSMAIMKLVEENKLNLDDFAIKYYPLFKTKGKFNSDSITIRQLLTHTSGLPKFLNNDLITNIRQGDLMSSSTIEIQKLKLQFKPGTGYLYSNVGFDVLGIIIENVSGLKYENYMSKYILEPLKMKHSTFNEINNLTDTSVAAPHDFKKIITLSNQIYLEKHSASAGLKASINDINSWMKACIEMGLNNQKSVLNPETFQHMWNDKMIVDSTKTDSFILGLGWDNGIDNGKPFAGKGGNLEWKSKSYIIIYKDLKLGIAIVSNFEFKDWDKFANQIIDEVLKIN